MKKIDLQFQENAGNNFETNGTKISIPQAQSNLKNARSNGNSDDICSALLQLAHLHFRQGHYQQTRSFVNEVVEITVDDSIAKCDAFRILGNCAAEMGEPAAAEEYYHQAISLARQLDYRYALYKCLHSLATNIYWPCGQFDLCLAAAKEALAQAQVLQLGEELWFPLSDIAWTYWSTGQSILANQIADQMQSIVSPGSLGDGFTCCLRAGQIDISSENLSRVLPLYERARSVAEATGDPGLNMEVRIGLCRTFRQIHDFPPALVWAEDAVAVSTRMNYRQFQGIALIERGRTYLSMEIYSKAESDFRAALELSLKLRANFDLTRATLYLAVILSANEQSEAADCWLKAVHLIQDFGYGFLIEQERTLLLPWIAGTLNSHDPILAKTSSMLFDQLIRTPPSPLYVKTLGRFTLQIGSNMVKKEILRQRRAGELLVLILSKPGYTVSAEQVSEALCPEKDTCASVDFYHHATSALRHLLEPDLPDRRFPCRYLEVNDERVSLLLPQGSTIDFQEFINAVQKKQWQRAIDLYQGEFLPSFRYAEWTIAIRQHLSDAYEDAMFALAEFHLQAHNPLACLEISKKILLIDSWQERAVELGMRAAAEIGERMTALKMYQRLEKILKLELGIMPQISLQNLYLELKNNHTK